MNIGHNTVSGQKLSTFVERVESIKAQKKGLGEQEALILAEAKADGFVPAAIRHVVKLRAMKPHDRQEAEAIIETYLHALGMATDTPLFRQVGLMNVDTASRESVIEALKAFVPANGAITVEAAGKPVKLTRDKDGNVTVSEVIEKPAPARSATTSSAKADIPDVSADVAEEMGAQAFRDNSPIIANPFPFGDARRARWDGGWRNESGTDGMGED